MSIRVGSGASRKRTSAGSTSGSKAGKVRDKTDEVLVPDVRLKLPHERDQTPDAIRTPSAVTRQAYRDVAGGLVDTDLRGTAGEKMRNAKPVKGKTVSPKIR